MSDSPGKHELVGLGLDEHLPLLLGEREPHHGLVARERQPDDLADAELDAAVHDHLVRAREVGDELADVVDRDHGRRTASVTREIAHRRPSSSVNSTSQIQVVRPRWRGVPSACTRPLVTGRRKVVLLDWPTAKLPSRPDGDHRRPRRHRLRQRGVGAAVHQPHRLLHAPLGREAAAAALAGRLEQLEPEQVVERSGRWIAVNLPFRHGRAHYSSACSWPLSISSGRAAGDRRARAPAGQELRRALRHARHPRGARARARPRRARAAGAGQRARRRGGLARPARRLRARPAGGPEATATRGHLRRSEAARSWTRSLLDSLEQLYPNGDLPAVPEGERRLAPRAPPAPRAPGATGREPGPLGPSAQAAVRRRRILAAAAGAVLLVAVLLWPIGLLTGDDDGDKSGRQGVQHRSQPSARARRSSPSKGKTQILVRPRASSRARRRPRTRSGCTTRTQAQVARRHAHRQAGQPAGDRRPARGLQGLEVHRRHVGHGHGRGPGSAGQDGRSVLRGLLELASEPIETGTGKNKATVLANIPAAAAPNSTS